MDVVKISKALSNQTRVDILKWLKKPENNFPPHKDVDGFGDGVCLVFIKEKSKLSQSTISQYMSQLVLAQLVIATRIGKWTYFKRNEKTFQKFSEHIKKNV